MRYIGIDPGITGAVAVIGPGDGACVYDTPVIGIKKGKKNSTDYLPVEMSHLLKDLTFANKNTHIFIEKVHSMPGQGVASMFNFGKGYGIWIGIISAIGLRVSYVTPQAWKKKLMKGMADKDAARLRAQELFPWLVSELSRKKDVGRADALLIAEYGKREMEAQ